jgi:subtilisin family serine protease
MRKRLLGVAALLLLAASGAEAQKVDQRLVSLAEQTIQRRSLGMRDDMANNQHIGMGLDSEGNIRSVSVQAYLKSGATCPTQLLEQKGITVRFVVDNVAALSVPVDKISELENIDELLFAKADELQNVENQTARSMTKADVLTSAQAAMNAGLPQAYTGKGVVLGIIDVGIDYNHAAFRDAEGYSRMKRVWKFQSNDGSYQPIDYNGHQQIKWLTTDNPYNSHGTHTLATAAGTDLGNGMQGVAPEAELMVIAMGNTSSESNIADGIRRIFAYADEVGKPCVVSISIGRKDDLHDGSSLTCKTVREQTANGTKPGRIVVMSSGNAATMKPSIIQKLGQPDADGWQLKAILGNEILMKKPNNRPYYRYPDFIAYAADGKDFTAELKIVNIETGEVISDLTNQLTDQNVLFPQPVTVSLQKNAYYPNGNGLNGGTSVVYKMAYSNYYIKLKNQNYRLAVFVKGTVGQTIKMVIDNRTAAEPLFFLPDKLKNMGYTDGNSLLSCNASNSEDAVISVGASLSTFRWPYYNAPANYPTANLAKSIITGEYQKVGDISDFSSYCVADDNGKPRPTLVGPGNIVCSAYNSYDQNYFVYDKYNGTADNRDLAPADIQVDKFDRTNWYGYMSGTSMSTPHVAGIIALWLQANPQLTTNQAKEVLKETCTPFDISQVPSGHMEQCGYGQIDALAGLKKILNTSGIEAIYADGHREATPATMFDVDAPVYNMVGQRVSRTQKGLVIYKGRKYLNR